MSRAGVPWEDLYMDDLVIIADSLEECVRRLLISKEAMEKNRLRVNAGKIKVMICGTGLDLLQSSGEYPCAVCGTGVGNYSIYCNGCKLWVHKKCSGLQRLTPNPHSGVASSNPVRSHTFVEIDHEMISTVILLPSGDSFKKGCCQLQVKVCAPITG